MSVTYVFKFPFTEMNGKTSVDLSKGAFIFVSVQGVEHVSKQGLLQFSHLTNPAKAQQQNKLYFQDTWLISIALTEHFLKCLIFQDSFIHPLKHTL